MQPVVMLVIAGVAMFSVIGGVSLLSHYYTLNGIKSRTVGDGQHGTARFATKKEIAETYVQVPYEPELWRRGENLPAAQGLVLGSMERAGKLYALVDTGDVHCLMIGAAGVGKTAHFLYPNIEYACACGMSFLTTDTKGDLYRNYAGIAKKYYGYHTAVIDLRNPTRSDGDNMLHLVNKYMDEYLADHTNLSAKAKAEKYAKITAKTIISSGGTDSSSYGQNAFFYDAAEGVLTAAILLIAEFCPDGKRHIISVFKLIQDLLAPSKVKGKNQFQLLLAKLPDTHKAKWFAGAALNTAEQSMQSVLSTALSRLNAFLDSELEQILCFDTAIDAELFCKKKTAVFLVMPEEDNTKYFIISLILQQLYREILVVADENGGKLNNRVVFYWDEVGTIPKIESAEMMFSASRSRRVSIVPMIQSFAQLNKNYGKEGAEIIIDNCQDTIFGGFAPNSESAEVLSKSLGNKTVMSGSISRGKNDPSQSLQMIQRPLMTADELKSLPKGNFIVSKTGTHPMRTKLKLFLKWGITFEEPYEIEEKSARKVAYADKQEIEEEIIRRYMCCMEEPEYKLIEAYLKHLKRSSYCFFTLGFAVIEDGFTNKKRIINLNADVAGLKSAYSSKNSWLPSAGVQRGKVIHETTTIILKQDYSDELYKEGVNAFKQNILSTQKLFINEPQLIDKLHSRNILNFVKRKCEKLLNKHVFNLNDRQVRGSISTELKLILEEILSSGGIEYGKVYVKQGDTPNSISINITIKIPTVIERININMTNVGTNLITDIIGG
jgi:type IV secretion system protein VirD4